MAEYEKQKVGERGQVTLPMDFRRRLDLHCGDEVLVHRKGSKIIVEKPVTREDLAKGYRLRSDRNRNLAEEGQSASREANDYLGDAPSW